MFSQFSKKTLSSKLISGIVAVSFILTSVPVRSYAALGTADKLRPSLAKTGSTAEITNEMRALANGAGISVEDNEIFGPPVKATLVNDNGIWIVKGLTVNGEQKEAGTRELGVGDLKLDGFFIDQKAVAEFYAERAKYQKDVAKTVAYWMFRNLSPEITKKDEIREDVTLIPPLMIGDQPIFTTGHYHPGNYTEVYVVLSGRAVYYLQKVDAKDNVIDAVRIDAKAGDVVVIPPGYGHITINPSKDETLLMMNWVSDKFKSEYGKIKEFKGGAYKFIIGKDGNIKAVKNENYEKDGIKLPPLRQGKVSDELAKAIGLPKGKPVHNVVDSGRSEDFKKLKAFLTNPLLSDDHIYDELLGRAPVSAVTPAPVAIPAPAPVPVQAVPGSFQLPLNEVPFINLAAENFIIGGKDAKTIGQNVGRAATLGQLKKLEILIAILGHSATRNAFVEANSKGLKSFLKQLARPKVDPFFFGPGRKGTQGKNAIINAFNQVCYQYSQDNKEGLGGIEIEVEPYVVAAAEKEAAEVQKNQKTIDSAEAFFDALAHFQAREIAAKKFDKIINDRILGQLNQGIKTITLCVGSENKGLPVEAEIFAVKKQLDINLNGVSAEDLVSKEFLLAFEPTSKIGTGTAADPDYIRQVHQAIFDWLEAKYGKEIAKNVWGKSFFCLYGGSADDKSIAGIMAVKSTRPDMQNVQLVHGVLFATYGKQVSGFLNIAKAVNEAAVRDNANYICFVNLKGFDDTEKTPRKDYLNEIYAAIKRDEINPVRTKLYIADQDTKLEGWKEALNKIHSEFIGVVSEKASVSKAEVASSPLQISGPEDLVTAIASKGIKQAIVAFDWNMPLKDGLVEDNEKLVNSVDTIKWLKESSLQYLYVMTHSGRPSGTGYEESFSLRPIVKEAGRLFKEEGLGDIEVVLLPYDFAQAKQKIDAKKLETATSGKKVLFVLENVRMYSGEQSKDPAIREQFEKEIIALTGEKTEKLVYLVEAFEKSHRAEEASMEMGFLLFPREHIAAGVNVVETVKVVSQFLSRVNKRFSVVAGGKKFDKLKNVADLGKPIGKSGGELFIIGALANPLLANKGISVGRSLMPIKDDEKKGFKDGLKKLTENIRDNKLKFSLPVDFIVKNGKQVKESLGEDDMQIDIGPRTIERIVEHIKSLGAGDGLLLNGGAGVFDADWGSKEGTIAVVTAANEAAKRGVAVLFGGGDMVNAVNMVVKETGLKLDSSISVSTAGGALFVAIAKGIGGGLIPVRAVMKFPGETTKRLLNVCSAVNEAFPQAMLLPATRTPYKDTSVNGDDATREPALDLSRETDGHHIAIPIGRRSDNLKNFYETTWLPFIVTAEDVALMPKEKQDAFFAAKKEKDVSAFAQKLMRQALIDKGVPVQDWQERSHQLDSGKLGEAGVDVSSIIGIRTRWNDLMVWVPILVKRGEDAAHLVLGKKITEGAAQNQARTAEVSFLLPKDISIADHKSAFDALKTYNPLFFDALQKGDLSSVNVLINIVNKLEPKAMVDPAVGGIEFNKELGVFISAKDTDEKATAPGFGKNLELFRGGLFSVAETCARLYHLATPNYDAQGKVSVVVKNKELQDAVIAFYARMQRHLLETAIQYFNDARIFESLRVEIGDYAQRLNKAVKESDALELSRASAEDVINHLTAKGLNLSSAEKANIESFITGSAGLFDVLQLAALLRVDTFTQGFRHLKLDYPKKVLASDKPFEAYDGSGRIARTQFAQRLAADINADEKGYIGRYMVASQELKGKSSKEKFKAAMQKAAEMLTDRQIEDAKIVVQVGQESVFLTNLIKSGRITFQAGKEVLAAQLDFQDTDQIPSAYAVHINLDGRLIGVVYCVDIAQFSSGLKTALQARERNLDNIPRPFIVRGENNEEIFFGLRVDATPGGVEIGDQELEVAGAKGTVKLGGDTLWKLFAKFNLPEPRGEKLTAADELARIRQIYNQVKETRMSPEGGKKIFYVKSQIPASLLLPGFNSLGRHLGWAIPFAGGADVMFVTPGSCSTNGASHTISALSALAGAVDSVGPTFHMYTSSDKIVEKNPSGHTALKSTGAAKGVVLLLSLGEGGQTFFTAIRTPTGLTKGKADIVGGSMFDLLVRLPHNIPDELIVRYLSRISAEFPQDIKLFDSKGGSYTWKEMIAGQKTGSILFADFIERVGPNIYRLKVGYDNEMSFGSKENALHEGIYLDALRNRQTAKMAEVFSKALANTTDVQEDLNIAKIIPSQTPVGSSERAKAVSALTPLLDINAIISRISQFNVPEAAISGFVNDETISFEALGGKEFSKLVDSAKIAQEAPLKVNGKLSNLEVVKVEEISDSRGKPTVRVVLRLGDIEVKGEVPAGASKGTDEAKTVDIDKAVANVNALAALLKDSGLDFTKHEDLREAEKIIAKNAGSNFERLGANATVPFSWALWRLAAKLNNMQLWEYIRKNELSAVKFEESRDGAVKFFMNIYNGGLHALKKGEALGKDRIDIQEIMIVPVGAKTHADALRMGDEIDQALKKILEVKYIKDAVTRADEAGFSVKGLGDSSEAIGYVLQAIKNAGYKPGEDVKLALDVAATTFYNADKNEYLFQGKPKSSEDMVNYYLSLVEKYPGVIVSIEDGLAENDWAGWILLTHKMKPHRITTIGDDLFVTQMDRLENGISNGAASGILIKVNQNGLVGGTLDVIKYALENGLKIVVSHRSGETLDDGIADLAYATRALGLKTGDPQPVVDFQDKTKWVRRNKYLRMVEIQETKDNKLEVSAKQLSQTVVQVEWQFRGAKAIRNFSIDISADSKEGVFMVDTITKQLNSAIAPVLQKNNLDLTKEEDYKFAMELTAAALKLGEIREITFNFVKDKLLPAMRENLSAKLGVQKNLAKPRALVINSRFFGLAGAASAIQKVTELFDSGYKLGLYGTGAEKIKALLGASDNIVIADTEEAVLAELDKVLGIPSEDTVVLGYSEFNFQIGVKQVVASSGSATLLVAARALKELVNNPAVDKAFEEFYQNIQTGGVIPEPGETEAFEMLTKVEGKGGIIDLSDIRYTKERAKQIENEAKAVKTFISEFLTKD